MKGFWWVKLHDLDFKMNKTSYFHLKQGNITITHTFMLHIGTYNVKSSILQEMDLLGGAEESAVQQLVLKMQQL